MAYKYYAVIYDGKPKNVGRINPDMWLDAHVRSRGDWLQDKDLHRIISGAGGDGWDWIEVSEKEANQIKNITFKITTVNAPPVTC